MSFAQSALSHPRPPSVVEGVGLPRKQEYLPSPASWRDEVIYFLLVDRFSDGREGERPLVDRSNLGAARLPMAGDEGWRWDRWAVSGGDRWQGGTLPGVTSKLDYLQHLGVTAVWLSPVFKQRGHLDTYHGYGIQDFLEVDPRIGTRADLVDLVSEAHGRGLRVILDVIFNHSGSNWLYPPGTPGGEHEPHYTSGRYPFGSWRGHEGQPIGAPGGGDDGVWPVELQEEDRYTRAGSGSLGAGDIDDPNAEHKRSDFLSLRDFRLDDPWVLTDLARCYKYWIALTGCDGFRIDTLKHVSLEQARNFCGTIREFGANIGMKNFFLVAEVAGGDYGADRYLDVLERNLNAALDIGEMRLSLNGLAKGLLHPADYFDGFDPGRAVLGSHRAIGERHVSVLDDHDHVFGPKLRFSAEAASDHQVVAGVALQLFTLGIPCVYYGTEQSLTGPEPGERRWLPGWGRDDRYLRETMFGPDHPRRPGLAGLAGDPLDERLPGFGPFGTRGHHCFDETAPAFIRIAALARVRQEQPVLRHGRQYLRQTSFLGRPFASHGPGEIVAWSRILDDEEALCVLNPHGVEARGADVIVDAGLNPPGTEMTVLVNTAEVGMPPGGPAFDGANRAGSTVGVHRRPDGAAYVEIRDLAPSEVLVLSNHPDAEEGFVSV